MVSEALTVSPKRINVRSHFRNETTTAIDIIIAFPMAAFGWNPGQSAWDANVGPVETFTVEADGLAVATEVARKALLNKRDITSDLRNAGLTDTQIFRSFGEMTMKSHGLPMAQAKKLNQLGAFQNDAPSWLVAETAY